MRYAGGYNIPGAAGNLAMSVLGNYEIAGAPRYIRGNFAPSGAIIKAPGLDSSYMDEQIRRGFVPMTPPVPRPRGPQLRFNGCDYECIYLEYPCVTPLFPHVICGVYL